MMRKWTLYIYIHFCPKIKYFSTKIDTKYSLCFKLIITIDFDHNIFDYSSYSKNYTYIICLVCDLLCNQRYFKYNSTFCIFA
jgi:hypothetical protein